MSLLDTITTMELPFKSIHILMPMNILTYINISTESFVCLFICDVYTSSDVYGMFFLEQLIMARTHMNPYNTRR